MEKSSEKASGVCPWPCTTFPIANYPKGAQYEVITARGGLELLGPERTVGVWAGTLSFLFGMPAHAVSFLQMRIVPEHGP